MKVLVVYDSVHGNTEKIAQAIAGGFNKSNEVRLLRSAEVKLSELEAIELLIVGSPTQAGRPLQTTKAFLDSIPAGYLKGIDVAAFDTRFSEKDKGFGTRMVLKFFQYAAGRISSELEKKGGHVVISPEGFIVVDIRGPLKEGDLERAAAWGSELLKRIK